MKKLLLSLMTAAFLAPLPFAAQATPAEDLKAYREFFKKRFPDVPFKNFKDGIYAINAEARKNWEAINEFPPTEPTVEEGKKLWETAFKNGKTWKDCFPSGPAMGAKFPYWDAASKKVVTLEGAVAACQTRNGEEAWEFGKKKIVALTAYVAYKSRGQKVNVVVPAKDPDALAAYEAGKQFFNAKRGQLNFSCADCHVDYAGARLRTELTSAALGNVTGWPTYRSDWGEVGSLHKRFGGCNKMVRAKPLKEQSEEYKNLEFFLTYLSNGLEMTGPSVRK